MCRLSIHDRRANSHYVSIVICASPVVGCVSFRYTTGVLIVFSHSHLSASTLHSVPAQIMTCQCLRYSATSVVIRFLAILSFTRTRHLSFGLPRFRFQSSVICNIFLVASSLSRLCTCPNHLNLFSLRNSVIVYSCASFHISSFFT